LLVEVISNRRTNLPKITSPNKHFPNLSNSVEIIYNEDVGRHGVAANDIQTGSYRIKNSNLIPEYLKAQFSKVNYWLLKILLFHI